MKDSLRALSAHLRSSLQEVDLQLLHGELTLLTHPQNLISILRFLRDNRKCAFGILVDICGVDYPERTSRFEVVYHLLSLTQNHRLRVKVEAGENTPIPSAVSIYPAANWHEREAFDLYGILFADHPDLRRLLTDYNFEGHPLRKDFPLTGFEEVRYDEKRKAVIYEPVNLKQEYRSFDFLSPWEGPPADVKQEGEN